MSIYTEQIITDADVPWLDTFCERTNNAFTYANEKNLVKLMSNIDSFVTELPWDGGYMDNFVYDNDKFDEMQKLYHLNYASFDDMLDDCISKNQTGMDYKVFARYITHHREIINAKFIISVVRYIENNVGLPDNLSDTDVIFKGVYVKNGTV